MEGVPRSAQENKYFRKKSWKQTDLLDFCGFIGPNKLRYYVSCNPPNNDLLFNSQWRTSIHTGIGLNSDGIWHKYPIISRFRYNIIQKIEWFWRNFGCGITEIYEASKIPWRGFILVGGVSGLLQQILILTLDWLSSRSHAKYDSMV